MSHLTTHTDDLSSLNGWQRRGALNNANDALILSNEQQRMILLLQAQQQQQLQLLLQQQESMPWTRTTSSSSVLVVEAKDSNVRSNNIRNLEQIQNGGGGRETICRTNSLLPDVNRNINIREDHEEGSYSYGQRKRRSRNHNHGQQLLSTGQQTPLLLTGSASDMSVASGYYGKNTSNSSSKRAAYLTTNDISFSSSLFNRNHVERWFFHCPASQSLNTGTSIVKFSAVPPHPCQDEPFQNKRIWKNAVIAFGTALPLPGMEQELQLAGKLCVVMVLQQPGCYWAEQICRKERGVVRVAQMTCWESGKAADTFRFSEEATEWRNNTLDMAIPGSFDGEFYRVLQNPHFQQLTQAVNLIESEQSTIIDDDGDVDDDEDVIENQSCVTESSSEASSTNTENIQRKNNHNIAMSRTTMKGIHNNDITTVDDNNNNNIKPRGNFVVNPLIAQEPAHAVFIEICPKRRRINKKKKDKGAEGDGSNNRDGTATTDIFASSDLFMDLLFASEACTIHEKGCLRYMILVKTRGQQQKQPLANVVLDKKQQPTSASARNHQRYTVYAVFWNEDAFRYHSKQGYSVLSERFKEQCAPNSPTITSYTRNTI